MKLDRNIRPLDIAMARVCAWLRARGLCCSVTVNGQLDLHRRSRPKPTPEARRELVENAMRVTGAQP